MDEDSENLRVQVGEVEVKDDESTEQKSNDPVEEDSDSDNTPPLHGVAGEDLSRPSSLHSGLSSRSRSTTVSDIDSSVTDNIKVVVRVRPLNPSEFARSDKNIIKFPGDAGAIWIDNNFGQVKPFTFNSVFEENTSQAEMFEHCGIKHLINMALEGYSCTAFAFGQTGSGKTYTITGPTNQEYSNQDEMLPSSEMLGLIERSFQYMFDLMDKKADQGSYTLKASYLEVYNERVKDLLNPSSTYDSLPVRWSRDRGFYVENLFYVECDTLDDLTAVLEEGLKYRQVGSHNMNDHTSRSHSMLTVYIDTEMIDPSDGSGIPILRHGKLSFVDLAGSERVKETKSAGEAFTESQNINKSLLTLGNCISALSDAKKRAGHIPYRDSKLTKLLADSLGGDGITLMIACISPSSYVTSDTLNTLRYAHRAKKIRNKPVVQMDPKQKLMISLKREIKLLRTENNYFRQQLGLPSSDSQTAITAEETTDHNGNKTINNNSSKSSKEPSQALGKPNSLLFVKEDERNQLTTANLTAGANSGLYDMLQEYMIENEHLRSENGDLHKSHNEISRQRTIVSRENESLLKKLEDLEQVFVLSSLSLRGLSQVEHAQSLSESGMMSGPVSHRTTHAGQVLGTRSSSNPDEYQHKQRSSSEPGRFPVSLPPLHNGPYPNYVQKAASATSSHKGSYSLQNPSLAEQSSSCKAWSKSCPAKLKKLPLTPEKHCGGYAQMFAKNREKQSKGEHLTDTTALQSTSKPLKAFTTHTPDMNNTNYLAALHSHQTPIDESRHRHAASHAPGVTQAYDKLEQDIGNIDSQIQYYSSLNQRMQQYSSPHR